MLNNTIKTATTQWLRVQVTLSSMSDIDGVKRDNTASDKIASVHQKSPTLQIKLL